MCSMAYKNPLQTVRSFTAWHSRVPISMSWESYHLTLGTWTTSEGIAQELESDASLLGPQRAESQVLLYTSARETPSVCRCDQALNQLLPRDRWCTRDFYYVMLFNPHANKVSKYM